MKSVYLYTTFRWNEALQENATVLKSVLHKNTTYQNWNYYAHYENNIIAKFKSSLLNALYYFWFQLFSLLFLLALH